MRDTSGICSRLGSAMGTLIEVRRETQGPFPVATGILEFLTIFKRHQTSSPFEALNSTCLSKYENNLRPAIEMRREPLAFTRVSRGDSDNRSSCEIKDEPAFKPLHGNPAFF